MRLRIRRKLERVVRRSRNRELTSLLRGNISIDAALHALALDASRAWQLRGDAAEMLIQVGDHGVTAQLLRQFFAQEQRTELWLTALALERAGDQQAVRPLIRALHDSNPDRRHAAARALGWIYKAGNRAAQALADALADRSQPQPVREEAAESLAYHFTNGPVPVLISALKDPDVRIRFWAVFGLGGIRNRRLRRDPRVAPALESMLSDNETPQGNWWSVGREALGMLGGIRLDEEIRRVEADDAASPQDRRWAEFYRSLP